MENTESVRLSFPKIQKRLEAFQVLNEIWGGKWLKRTHKKPLKQWPLWMGWLSLNESTTEHYLLELENSLKYLSSTVSPKTWQKIKSKLRAPSDRANSKGILAELSMWLFLAVNGFSFSLDAKLPFTLGKDMDIEVMGDDGELMYIEVQWLSPSDESDRAARIAAEYGEVATWKEEYESHRIALKVKDKVGKMTRDRVTLVALDYTSEPSLGNHPLLSFVAAAADEVFAWEEPSKVLDGIIWFRWEQRFFPVERYSRLNPFSPFTKHRLLQRFLTFWDASG